MFPTANKMRPKNNGSKRLVCAKTICSAFGMFLLLMASTPGNQIEQDKLLFTTISNNDAPVVYHTLTTQCRYPGTANVTLMMASTNRSLRQRAVNNLKNCLEPTTLQ